MKVKNIDVYKNWKEQNTDGYGEYIFMYAERWANLMEDRMIHGESIEDMGKATSSEADTQGITGFMHGMAVNILAHCWVHGKELRVWHNKEWDHEGDGVVNPAVININQDQPEGAGNNEH